MKRGVLFLAQFPGKDRRSKFFQASIGKHLDKNKQKQLTQDQMWPPTAPMKIRRQPAHVNGWTCDPGRYKIIFEEVTILENKTRETQSLNVCM